MREMRQQLPLLRLALLLTSAAVVSPPCHGEPLGYEGPENRKLAPSPGTSMSVIMDHPNGTKTYITDGEPAVKPTVVGSPASLMSPDRYEFYSFGKDGELVKKLMTLEQIQGLIAGADELNLHDENGQPAHYYQQPLVQAGEPEGVSKVLESVQNVLKSELQTAHVPDRVDVPPLADDSWSLLFPGLFNGNFDFKESLRGTPRPTNVTETPLPESTTPTTTFSTTVQAVKVTSPRHPSTPTTSKAPERPSSKTTARLPPQSPATTVKYSAHYTTPPPNVKLQNKPAPLVKKPTGTQPKPQQPVKTTAAPAVRRPTTNGTVATRLPTSTTRKPTTNATAATTYKGPNVSINTTLKPTTAKGTTERMRPSGIPTITHYLPVQTSIGPSEAVKTVKPMVPTKPTVRTTPKPPANTTKVYSKPQATTASLKKPSKPSHPSTTTKVQASTFSQASTNKNQVPLSSLKTQPVAEKLVQEQPETPPLQAASSDRISVSVSTPSGPPSTLKITAGTTVRPTTAKPITKVPPLSIQPNKTVSAKPVSSPNTDPPKAKPKPTPSVSASSIATHKPVLVMVTTAKPQVKTSQNNTSATTHAPVNMTKFITKAPLTRPTTITQSRLPTTAAPTSTTTQPSTTFTMTTDASTTLTSELAQAPLKLAATLKEPQQNVFEQVPLMSTTLKEAPVMTVATTESTTKWEQIASSAQALTTYPSTVAESKTVSTAGSTIVTTDLPTTLSKVYIINNSEPQKIKLPIKPPQKPHYSPFIASSTIADWINSRTESLRTTETVSTSTSTDAPSTMTESPSTTTFKDQVMEEGMSAVASILLDDKVTVDKNALAERLAVSATPFETTTTESTTVARAETTLKEDAAFREEPVESDRASTRRNDDSWRTTTSLPSTVTTSAETTTIPPTTDVSKKDIETTSVFPTPTITTTTPSKTTSPPITSTTSRSIPSIATTSTTSSPPPMKSKTPVKESKLNPESDEQPQESHIQLHQMSTEGTTMVMEQIKLTEKNSISPSLQPPPAQATTTKISFQEPKVPSPALKRPSYSNEVIPPPAIDLHPAPYESMGAEASTAFLAEDVRRFADLCNELAFRMWTALTSKGQISSRSLVMSPFAGISLLAMVFLGARGATSGQMNEILRLDDMVTFNPHQVLQNVTESVINSRDRGVATAAFVRQLYSDKSKGKILDFYKERAQQYYGGHVEEVSFSTVGDVVRRRTNLLIKRQTLGKVPEYLRGSSLNLRPPLAAFSANIFQTDCESGSTDGRDGEMYFVVRPSTRQRRLVPVPAVVWRTGFSAGYEPSLDATSVCLGQESVVSTLLILPGQQGQVAPGDGLARLEQRLIETSYRRGGWSRLLRSLLPRPGLELQVPRFSHRSVLNVTSALERMGLRDLFGYKADLRGLNGGATELHLSDMVQVNTFSTCGEEVLGARHHIETYPASPQRTGREDAPLPKYLDDEPHYEPRRSRYHFNGDDMIDGRPRTGRLPMAAPSTDPAPPRLRFDRPFLYVVRHNPSGIILHIGRFNPRLLP